VAHEPHDEVLDDGAEDEASPAEAQTTRAHPLDGWSEARIASSLWLDLGFVL
jgi:hypothetical protein